MNDCQRICSAAAVPGTTAWVACLSSCNDIGVYVPDSGVPVFQANATASCPTPWLLIFVAAVLGYYIGRA